MTISQSRRQSLPASKVVYPKSSRVGGRGSGDGRASGPQGIRLRPPDSGLAEDRVAILEAGCDGFHLVRAADQLAHLFLLRRET